MENNQYTDQLILKYLEATITSEEWNELESWLQENERNLEYFDQMRTIWIAAEAELQVNDELIEQEWTKLEKRHFAPRMPNLKWKQAVRIAAVFAVGALFSWAISNYRYNNYFSQMKESVITAPLGAKSTVVLPDGTTVVLNAGSVLKYPGDFSKKIREVTLEGEAYFEVAKNKSKLFQVRTSDVTVKAYGTKFNVKSYRDEKTIETTLIEGSVSVTRNRVRNSKQEELFLKPHEQLVFYKATSTLASASEADKTTQAITETPRQSNEKILISKGIDPQLFTSWTEDRLIMKSEPMQKMAVRIERKYNVKIHFEDEDLKNFRFSGIIENETLENVLAAISIASPVEYTLKDRDIWLRKKPETKKSQTNQLQ